MPRRAWHSSPEWKAGCYQLESAQIYQWAERRLKPRRTTHRMVLDNTTRTRDANNKRKTLAFLQTYARMFGVFLAAILPPVLALRRRKRRTACRKLTTPRVLVAQTGTLPHLAKNLCSPRCFNTRNASRGGRGVGEVR